MLLSRIHLNPRNRDARRDLADPYQLHASLCRAFSPSEQRCPPGEVLWRLEPETHAAGFPRLLVQSRSIPDWSHLPRGWLTCQEPAIDLARKLRLDALEIGARFRFRLRANPCKTVQGKRLGLVRPDAQRDWLVRKSEKHGFRLPEAATRDYFDFIRGNEGRAYHDFHVSREQMLKGRQHDSNTIQIYSVLFEGRLIVTDPALFVKALRTGIGHGKVMGLGLLSVIPIPR